VIFSLVEDLNDIAAGLGIHEVEYIGARYQDLPEDQDR
jgi:hypothetical protein